MMLRLSKDLRYRIADIRDICDNRLCSKIVAKSIQVLLAIVTKP